jgi:two-component system, NtrC family, response regulator AtoC
MEKILIVDDDEGLVHFLERFFAKQGYGVRSCNSGQAALEAMAREPFDLILLDYKMPGLNGLDTLREVRTIPGQNPGHHHDGLRHHGHGHRGHEAGSLRLSAQTL